MGLEIDSEVGRRIGAVILPELRAHGASLDDAYLRRYPPLGVVASGRDALSGELVPGLETQLAALAERAQALGSAAPFVCCALDEGAGAHFAAGTRLPPALALAAAERGREERGEDGPRWVRSAAVVTALEARALGVALVLAPSVDVCGRERDTRAAGRGFGDDPERVAALAAEFVSGLHAGGAGACLASYPGSGEARGDPRLELPRLEATLAQLRARSLVPFAALAPAWREVEAISVGHVDAPALTGEPGVPVSLSRRAVARGLIAELGFRGAVLTDGLRAAAVAGEREPFARALRAGCHGLLGPLDPEAAAAEVLTSAEDPERDPRVSWMQLELASRQLHALAATLARRAPTDGAADASLHPAARPGAGRDERRAFALACAAAALCASPGGWPWSRGQAARLEVLGGPAALRESLERELGTGAGAGPRAPELIAVGAGDAGAAAALLERMAHLRRAKRPVGVLWFAAPGALPSGLWGAAGVGVVVAFAPTPPLVSAAAAFARGRGEARGSLPTRVG